MARKFTPTAAQKAAIDIKNSTVLVSAAAGSGKTATLTERIISSVTDKEHPSDISRMLIVTFTKAAAADLKTKISRALSEALAANPTDRHLNEQIIMLGSAKISTIDSFYLDIVRANFQKIKSPDGIQTLSPDFRIIDPAENSLLMMRVMNECIDRGFASDPNFPGFTENFADAGNTDSLADIFIGIYQKLLPTARGIDFLSDTADEFDKCASGDFSSSVYMNILREYAYDKILFYRRVFADACDMAADDPAVMKAYQPSFKTDLDFCDGAFEAIKSGTAKTIASYFSTYSPKTLGRLSADKKPEWCESYLAYRSPFKKAVKEFAAELFSTRDEDIKFFANRSADICRQLRNLLFAFSTKLSAEKFAAKVAGFDDVRNFTLRLLRGGNGEKTTVAKELCARYDEVYIDEYQDVDEVQNLIFSLISRENNRFMVGDIKQSIYGFRGTDCSIFASLRKNFPPYGSDEAKYSPNCSIFLSNNFRSEAPVLKFANTVCSYLFGFCPDSIGYTPTDDLICSKTPVDGYEAPKIKIAVIEKPKKSDTGEEGAISKDTSSGGEIKNEGGENDGSEFDAFDNERDEAKYIACETARLLNTKKADGSPVKAGDIAVLVRSMSMGKCVASALNVVKIPVSDTAGVNYFENPEVLLVLSLLCAIDNPERDVYTAAVLRSPFFGFDMSELVTVRKSADDRLSLYNALEEAAKSEEIDETTAVKIKRFLEKLSVYRRMSESLSADRLIRHIYRDLSVMSYASSDFGNDSRTYAQKRDNLLRLYEYARKFEQGGFKGLHNFTEYLTDIISKNTKLSPESSGLHDDCVKIITIHASKGLEFPVCILAGTASKFNKTDIKDNFLLMPHIGAAMRICDSRALVRMETPFCSALRKKKSEVYAEEEMRVLYVALTRARERLIITAKPSKKLDNLISESKMTVQYGTKLSVTDSPHYLSWILNAIEKSPDKSFFELVTINSDEIGTPTQTPYFKSDKNTPSSSLCISQPSDTEEIGRLKGVFRRRFDFAYPYAHITHIPAKLSVSRLYPDILDGEGGEGDVLLLSNAGDIGIESVDIPEFSAVPEFFSGEQKKRVTAAQRGTATHLFLQFCDFSFAKNNGIEAELTRLVEKKYIPADSAAIVDKKQLERFFESRFFASLESSTGIWRETRFNLLLPASMFTKDEALGAHLENERLAVQGVIDLFYIDGDGKIVLCDYKTDALTKEQLSSPALAAKMLSERHGMQLSYYAAAVHRLLGKSPDRICVYSLPLGEAIDVTDIFEI